MVRKQMVDSAGSVLATAEVFIRFGRLDAAEKCLKTALGEHDGDQLALILTKLALVHELQGQFKQALQCLRQAVQNTKEAVEPGLCLAALLCDLSQYDEAKKAFSSAAGVDDNAARSQKIADAEIAELHVQIAMRYENSGRHSESQKHLEKALELSDRQSNAARLWARQLVAKSKAKELLKFLAGPGGMLLVSVEREVFEAIAYSQLDGIGVGTQKLQSIQSFDKDAKDRTNRRLAAGWGS